MSIYQKKIQRQTQTQIHIQRHDESLDAINPPATKCTSFDIKCRAYKCKHKCRYNRYKYPRVTCVVINTNRSCNKSQNISRIFWTKIIFPDFLPLYVKCRSMYLVCKTGTKTNLNTSTNTSGNEYQNNQSTGALS